MTVFSQSAQHILDVDNGIIDHHTQSDGEAAKCHCIERRAERTKQQYCAEQRQWNCCKVDQLRSPFQEESDQNEHHEEAADQNGHIQVAHCLFNKCTLAKE